MKKIKNLMLILCCVLLCVNSISVSAFASDEDQGAREEIILLEGISASVGAGGTADPMDNYQRIEKTAISANVDISWVQPMSYGSYRIWVQNTSNETLTVTHKSGLVTRIYVLEPNTQRTVDVVNDAIPLATHVLSFSTPSGAVSGYVAVRVSQEALTY